MAVKGLKDDGHLYLPEVCRRGAECLLVQDEKCVPKSFPGTVARTPDTRVGLSQALNEFYDFPSKKMFVAGVTGTNGKTSTAYMVECIFNFCGWPTALMGTVDRHFKNQSWPSNLTTPEPIELFRRMGDFLSLSAKALALEVSSIALDQRRTDGLDFNVGVFTNLTRDHLDYHLNFEKYFSAKKRLFRLMEGSGRDHFVSVINRDDPYGRRLIRELRGRVLTFGEERAGETPADFSFKVKSQNLRRTVFSIRSPEGRAEGEVPLMTPASNIAGALAVGVTAGFSLSHCVKALKGFSGVPGRLEKITPTGSPFQVFVDYAHTPSALTAVLKILQSCKKRPGRIVTVFGCGGDRDREKRGEMAETAHQFSDQVILTSDNPRGEDPLDIIEECLRPLSPSQRKKWIVEEDRKKAIELSVEGAQKGDFIVILGKGHERVQVIGDKRIPFDDREIAKACLSRP